MSQGSGHGGGSGSDASGQRGQALLDLVAVMDRLRSPGGCPWDAQQTHASLVPYLIEETYEAVEALESADRAHVVEELGDVLLQVVFHARIGQEHPEHSFDIDDVAADIAAKLRRRHPHVFADAVAETPEQVAASWAAIKAAEKAERAARARGAGEEDADGTGDPSPLHGIPAGMPSLARAAQVVARLDRAGRGEAVDRVAAGDSSGARLLALVAELVRAGHDPDAELRGALRAVTEGIAPPDPPR